MTRYVIVGDGAAGITAAHYIRRHDPGGDIQIVSDDPNPAYYRAALTNYLIGELREEQLFAVPPDFYTAFRVGRTLDRVASVDVANGRVALAHGRSLLPFDRLLIAAGASPNAPPFPGGDVPGVMTMRTLQDARLVLDDLGAKRVRRAVVVGGGPLGIEWVQGLRARGVEVTYVLRGRRFMEGILDQVASDLVLSRLRAFGVDLRLDEEVAEAVAGRDGRLQAVRLRSGGSTLPCQLVGVAIGIRANVGFLEGSGIKVDRGIRVDASARTNHANVFAAGDIAEAFDESTGRHRSFGLWEPARLQARAAGINMAGGDEAVRMGAFYNATRLYDLDFASVGRTIEEPTDEVHVDYPRATGRLAYRKLVVRDRRLEGALMVGARADRVRARGLQYKRLIDLGLDVSTAAGRLLDPGFDLGAWTDSQEAVDAAPAPPAMPERRGLSTRAYVIRLSAAGGTGIPSPADMMRQSAVVSREALGLAAAPGGEATLSVRSTGQSLPVRDVARIGRREGNEVLLADPEVSATHAVLRRTGEGFVLTDSGSRNGTFVNGERIGGPALLAPGDVVRVGQTELIFRVTLERAASAVLRLPEPAGPAGRAPAPSRASRVMALDEVLGRLQVDGRTVELREPVTTIGRDPSLAVSLPDQAVSFLHAQVTLHGRSLYLRDLGSRNGTYVNRQLVTIPHELRDGDVIHVGDTDVVFRGAEARAAAPAAAATAAPVPAQAPTIRAIRLVVTSGADAGRTFGLEGDEVAVGRDAASEMVLADPTVSRHHARLVRRGDGWALVDAGSRNGTRVGGTPVTAGEERPVATGDELRFGDVIAHLEEVT